MDLADVRTGDDLRTGGGNEQVLERRALLTNGVEAPVPLHSEILDSKAEDACGQEVSAFMQKHGKHAESKALGEWKQPQDGLHWEPLSRHAFMVGDAD